MQSGPSSKQPENGHEKATANGVAHSWEDSDEKKAQDAEQALAEKVKSLSEKEYNKQIKILEYEKRMSSSYAEFFWEDPLDVVSAIYQASFAYVSSYGYRETASSRWHWRKATLPIYSSTMNQKRSYSRVLDLST